MSDRPPAVELRRSVAVLATEWWLLAGAVAGYLLYGVWVIATGLAVETFAPTLTTTTVTTGVTGLVVLAAVAWVLVPAVVATWLLDRRLSNDYGNLVSQYRIDNPGVLPAPSGVLVLLAAAAAVVVGPQAPVVTVLAVASVHLFVRTVAFGRRVYSFSPRPLFTVLSVVSAAAMAAAWLVHAPGLPGSVGERVASAGVASVVETGLGGTGLAPATALGVLVTVPAFLSGAYLAVQALAARSVRAKAPLARPDKRAEQRYPIMPPVADSSRPGPPTPSANSTTTGEEASAEPEPEERATPESAAAADSSDDGADDHSSDDGSSHTRVFTTDEPIPDDGNAMAAVAEDGDEEDGWIDDTAIFTPEGTTSSEDECGACGESIPRESVTFCPNCGERIKR
jgi:hypothetical protein